MKQRRRGVPLGGMSSGCSAFTQFHGPAQCERATDDQAAIAHWFAAELHR